jgi:hypothetical protein
VSDNGNAPAPAPADQRADWIRAQLLGITGVTLNHVLAELAGASTEGLSLQERMLSGAMRPWLPKVRELVLSKLSASDGRQLELIAGALAQGIDDTLAAAPGDPLPRHRPVWTADRKLAIVPIETTPASSVGHDDAGGDCGCE